MIDHLPLKSVKRLHPDDPRKAFDCGDREGDKDLNDFFLNASADHSRQLLTITYGIETDSITLAFFSVLNDKIEHRDSEKRTFNKIERSIPNSKRRKTYPAVKVARFGVHKKYQGQGYGTALMDYIKIFFLDKNKTGCRFITVDAYNTEQTINFYLKNEFVFLTSKDEQHDTRAMYFDLMPLAKKYQALSSDDRFGKTDHIADRKDLPKGWQNPNLGTSIS